MAKSLAITYLLWLTLGWFGAHHFYLGRDRHGLVWYMSFGGVFTLGWFRDIWRIPAYVDEANGEGFYMPELLQHRERAYRSPPFNIIRFIGEICVGTLLGAIIPNALPRELLHAVEGHHILQKFVIRFVLPPISVTGVAIGVHLVGNIGHEKVSIKMALLGASLGWLISNVLFFWAINSAMLVNCTEKKWAIKKQKRGVCYRFAIVSLCALVFTALMASDLYHNYDVDLPNGEKIKLRVVVKNVFNLMGNLWDHYLEHGFTGLYEELMDSMISLAEMGTYGELGLKPGASEIEVEAAYRRLVKQWDPDKDKDPVWKFLASQRFARIQEAYEILSILRDKKFMDSLKKKSKVPAPDVETKKHQHPETQHPGTNRTASW